MVGWNLVGRPLAEGGLGIRLIKQFNQALLGNWLWIFFNEENNLWHKVIAAKYGVHEMGWDSKIPQGAYGSSLRKGIYKGYEVFRKNVTMLVGRGDKVQFWKDVWVGETPLNKAFPTMYQLARMKEGTVFQHYAHIGEETS